MNRDQEKQRAPARAVCLNCIDGRAQLPAVHWIMDNYEVHCVDMITEPGMDGLLADPGRPIDEIQRKVRLSIDVNNASVLIVVAHHDCRGNPVGEPEHKEHVFSALRRLQKIFSIPVVGLWINEEGTAEKLTL